MVDAKIRHKDFRPELLLQLLLYFQHDSNWIIYIMGRFNPVLESSGGVISAPAGPCRTTHGRHTKLGVITVSGGKDLGRPIASLISFGGSAKLCPPVSEGPVH
ncbi:hypothetical protein LCGC14_0621360 [marine sediment metagenome]|uniref:Uncharacterized protein n=1 Tax=marine sediment metagenome TaxID=412755 RepID=A0A0F9R9T2_9ZZZZ